jgi:hypothetical protein
LTRKRIIPYTQEGERIELRRDPTRALAGIARGGYGHPVFFARKWTGGATVPDFYYKTIGQAWGAMVAAFTANNQLTYNDSGFSVSWHDAIDPYGGYFTVAGTVYVGDTYANGNYHASEAKVGSVLPIAGVLREPGMSDMPVVTVLATAGLLTIADFLDSMRNARATMIVSVCDGVSASLTSTNLDPSGGGTPVARVAMQAWTTDDDCAVDTVVAINAAGQPGGAPVTYPFWPTFQALVTPQSLVSVDVGPQLDTDIAINNGSSINTSVAKQFTGI